MSQASAGRSWDVHRVPPQHLVLSINDKAVAIVPTNEHARAVVAALSRAYSVPKNRVIIGLPTEVDEVYCYDTRL